jgi:hypothetical protein
MFQSWGHNVSEKLYTHIPRNFFFDNIPCNFERTIPLSLYPGIKFEPSSIIKSSLKLSDVSELLRE